MHKNKRRGHSKPRSKATIVTLAIVSGIAFALFVGAATLAAPGGAKGKPGGGSGGGSTQILPVSLGAGPSCASSGASGINNNIGYSLYVTAQGTMCGGTGDVAALRWTLATGMEELGALPRSSGASAEDVADNGMVVGFTSGPVAMPIVIYSDSAAPTAMPLSSGMTWGSADGISANGQYVIGVNGTDETWRPARWIRAGQGWSVSVLDVTDMYAPATPAISNDGTAIVNRATRASVSAPLVGHAGFWSYGSTNWTELPGYDTLAYDINAAGDWIVGERWEPCASRCSQYAVPVYWIKTGAGWTGPFDLPALDTANSTAYAIAERGGRKIIVGVGTTSKDSIRRAVYWLQQSDGSFRLNRLAALDGRSRAAARAVDVNNAGQVVGVSAASGLSNYAVMWTLP